MKKVCIFVGLIAMSLIYAAVVIAGSAGGYAPAIGGKNVPLTVPKKASTECKAVTVGRSPAIVQFTVSGTTMVNWKAFKNSDGTAVVAKRSFDSYSSNFIPGSSETNLPIEGNITNLNFKGYSTATAYRICVEKN